MPSGTRSRLVVAALTLSVFALTAGASSGRDLQAYGDGVHADSAAVVSAINSFHAALSTGDSTRALGMLASDVTILESGGLETKADYRSHHLVGDISFAKAVKSVPGPLKVTIEGNTAWTTGTSLTKGEFNGRQINSVGAESAVLTRTKTGWRIRSIHWSSKSVRKPVA
ncbi:MAG: nuclear transport factor 2 family protein [Gemmatimonadaceae bacterium]